MNSRRPIFALLASLVLLPFTACSPQPSDCSGENAFCVGLVTAYEDVEEHGLNQASWEALQSIQAQAEMTRLDYIQSLDTRDWQKNILFFADNGYDVIVTVGQNLDEATVDAASDYPNTVFIGIDQRHETVHANIATIHFPEEQAGFLAGVLASLVTETDRVGAICETSGIDAVWRYCEGFRAGVEYESDEVRAYVAYREDGSRDKTFNDPEWGEERARSFIDNNVDVLTAFGGNTARGAYLEAAQNHLLVIGSEDDLYFILPSLRPVLITSVIKDPGATLVQLVLRASLGEIPAGMHTGQIRLVPFRPPQYEMDAETQAGMEEVIQGIGSGEIAIDLPEKE